MWNEIKQILKKTKGTCIIVEDGQPAYIVTLFDDYQKSLDQRPENKIAAPRFKENINEPELTAKINQEIVDWKVKQAEAAQDVQLSDIQDSDELRIENLPLA
ncbi:MAG: hypothetical protein UW11_C0007G0008 [Parcubacteria group bacterium GW2011_GWA2_43_9b]|uniref:Prevent-host-death protein n=1 Tax=Candidatus Portnoybacteria bacterium RIFCSPLOWO2_02_FULL_39_11 TaxID=1802001 RepID=A0A1G2FVZ4_9BACT|nr:MAG: hypothetical protein UW11_C0007G0008 [Parcubacteria group bacterium GW2011_GWA2_43_9b]OGZ42233.1 MAG: hypothetical protein A3B04_02760 [Candidatus Portnoybacteria bacterium RIFCSPLOWO2_02_FULL_39_11]